MTFVTLSASRTVRAEVNKPLHYDHKQFNEAIEVVIKMLDRLDHYDRIFAVEAE
jgi:hypothetical protein